MTTQQREILTMYTEREAMSYDDLVMRLGDGNRQMHEAVKALSDRGFLAVCEGQENKVFGESYMNDAELRITQAGRDALETETQAIKAEIRANAAILISLASFLISALTFFLK